MDGHPVFERDDSQKASLQFWHFGPKAITVVLLGLRPNWFLYDPDAPLPFQVWPLPENLILEVVREAIRRHKTKDTAVAAPVEKNFVWPRKFGRPYA